MRAETEGAQPREAGIDMEIIADGLAFPEGPIAMEDGSVLFVEVLGGTLSRAWNGRRERIAHIGGGPNGAQIGPDGAVYICNNGGVDTERMCSLGGVEAIGRIERVDLSTGKVERVHDHVGDRPLSSPNDLIFDAQGNMWFTDFGKHFPAHMMWGGLYYADIAGNSIKEAAFPGVTYNGVALSPDGATLYVSTTRPGRVFTFALDSPGVIAAPAVSVHGTLETLLAKAEGDAWFDSMAVTQAGTLCVGTLGVGGITTISQTGDVRHIPMADSSVTNIAFGGRDMQTAYITFAATGRLVRMRWDEPGLRLHFNG